MKRFSKKVYLAAAVCAAFLFPASVFAEVQTYEETVSAYEKEQKAIPGFVIDNGSGEAVQAVKREDTLYVTEKDAAIRTNPGEKGKAVERVLLGEELFRVAVCDNGWSKVKGTDVYGNGIIGYVKDEILSSETTVVETNDEVTAAKDCDILDFPGRKDGQVIGEILEMDEVKRDVTVDGVWSRIFYEDENGEEQVGYIPTDILEDQEEQSATSEMTVDATTGETADTLEGDNFGNAGEKEPDSDVAAGVISKSEGKGIFAEAVEDVTATEGKTSVIGGIQVGTPVAASSDALLKSLGTFRITHYCPCSICCGPWANGITSTGVTATTNHTIAVDPTQIPYGSQVVINGQVYVAEDCGGAIKTNCIDIYVASHEEGESKGVYYTEVYLIQ